MNDNVNDNVNDNLTDNAADTIVDAEKRPEEPEKRGFWHSVLQWLIVILIAAVVAYIVNVFVFERAKVQGESMLPTLHPDESLFEYKTGYLFSDPERGDIIVFEHDAGRFESPLIPFDPTQENYVKRVIGMPGETIDIADGHVYINGTLLVEPYLDDSVVTTLEQQYNVFYPPEVEMDFPYTIPEGEYFVMGDNREHSTDSRSIGSVKKERIRGKIKLVMFPFSKIRVPDKSQPYLYSETDAADTGDQGE